jgi:titin
VIAVNTTPNPDESSVSSETVSISMPAAPAAPINLQGFAVRSGSRDLVTLTWTDLADNELGFEIQRSTSASFTSVSSFSVGANITTFSQNVSRTNNYYYRVRAANAAGFSEWTNVVLVITP